MLTDRQKLILKAIVEEYVKTAVPVGSFALIDKPYLNFSSATIRAEMAYLEDKGYIEKTHTSSGRIPSDKGYRYYVENLVTRDYNVVDKFPLIDEIFLNHELARNEAIKEAINLLSDLTNYTSVVLGPNTLTSTVKKIDFIPLSEKDAVILIVTNQGHVQNQVITVPNGMKLEDLRQVVLTLDDVLKNMPLSRVPAILNEQFARMQINELMKYQDQLINSFLNAFQKFYNENIYLSGMSNVFELPEFNDVGTVKRFMKAMDKKSLIRLVGDDSRGLSVKIGLENEVIHMDNCTIISVPYRVSEEEIGKIAVIGPTRMEYKKVIPLVEYIASNLTKLYRK